jgi:hypothetical protein
MRRHALVLAPDRTIGVFMLAAPGNASAVDFHNACRLIGRSADRLAGRGQGQVNIGKGVTAKPSRAEPRR